MEVLFKENNSVLTLVKEWEEALKNPPVAVENDDDLPEDIRKDVERLRNAFNEMGIDVSKCYLVDFDVGGPVLAVPVENMQVELMFNIKGNENEKSRI